jgi:hypothetical protein
MEHDGKRGGDLRERLGQSEYLIPELICVAYFGVGPEANLILGGPHGKVPRDIDAYLGPDRLSRDMMWKIHSNWPEILMREYGDRGDMGDTGFYATKHRNNSPYHATLARLINNPWYHDTLVRLITNPLYHDTSARPMSKSANQISSEEEEEDDNDDDDHDDDCDGDDGDDDDGDDDDDDDDGDDDDGDDGDDDDGDDVDDIDDGDGEDAY